MITPLVVCFGFLAIMAAIILMGEITRNAQDGTYINLKLIGSAVILLILSATAGALYTYDECGRIVSCMVEVVK